MKAVMYGGGNIGRGFIGALFSASGYNVTFIDVADAVVSELREKKSYPLRYVSGDTHEDVLIKNVTAVNGNDAEAASDAIAECDIMATAVGARILKFIVPNIVAGLRKRWASGAGPLNIIICENLMDANLVLEGMIKENLTDAERIKFDETVGLVEASIGRMVPIQTDEMKDGEPLRVCVEKYGFLPVDKSAFKGEIPSICGMIPFSPFDFYIKRKLYIHNMGHAVCAYLGDILGLEYIYEAIDNPEIRLISENAMLESAEALSKKYSVDLSLIQSHITDLLFRFTNAALRDTCKRVGGDPARKLSPSDRLIGSASLALDMGITPAYIAVGAAAGLKRYINETESPEQTEATAARVLSEISALEPSSKLSKLILTYYTMLTDNCDISSLRRTAERIKRSEMGEII